MAITVDRCQTRSGKFIVLFSKFIVPLSNAHRVGRIERDIVVDHGLFDMFLHPLAEHVVRDLESLEQLAVCNQIEWALE